MQAYFLKLKQNLELNPSFDKTVQTRHDAVRSAIENTGAVVKDTRLIGSLQRKTRIQPRPGEDFDVDILVVLGTFNNWLPPGSPNGITPAKALSYVYGSVSNSDRYSTKNPEVDAPTVGLEFADDVKVELVPAYFDMIGHYPNGAAFSPKGRGYWVPKNGRWELADYDFEAEHITEMNEASAGYLVPTIKMLKAIKKVHFPYFQSFPLEIIAAQIIPSIVDFKRVRNQRVTYPELIQLFCALAKNTITQPIRMPGSNSPAIILDPVTIQALNKKLGNIADHIGSIDRMTNESSKAGAWRLVFGEFFPATVTA